MKRLACLGFILSLTTIFFISCQVEDQEFGTINVPTNINVDVDIVGMDSNNPNGDGSGSVNFTTTADNAIAIHYLIQGERILADSEGKASFRFTELGLNTYEINVVAFGTGGASSNTTLFVDVLSVFEAPEAVVNKIKGLTMRIKAENPKHFGLGPVGGSTPCEWYGAGPFEKSTTGMYDDRYVFNDDGTFVHITNSENDDPVTDTSGTVFGRINLIDELGPHNEDPNGADIENYPLDDYQSTWSLIPLGDDGIGLRLTGTAFMGYYTGGSHVYELFQYEEQEGTNDFILRTTDGNGEFDWWFIITSDE